MRYARQTRELGGLHQAADREKQVRGLAYRGFARGPEGGRISTGRSAIESLAVCKGSHRLAALDPVFVREQFCRLQAHWRSPHGFRDRVRHLDFFASSTVA